MEKEGSKEEPLTSQPAQLRCQTHKWRNLFECFIPEQPRRSQPAECRPDCRIMTNNKLLSLKPLHSRVFSVCLLHGFICLFNAGRADHWKQIIKTILVEREGKGSNRDTNSCHYAMRHESGGLHPGGSGEGGKKIRLNVGCEKTPRLTDWLSMQLKERICSQVR